MKAPFLAFLAVLSGAASQVAQPPTPPKVHSPEVFGVQVDSVYVDAFVSQRRDPVVGLTAADFELKDNGVVQKIDLVSAEALPLTAVLVFDSSNSLAGERLAALQASGVAVWDVLQSCVRPGSLDTAIERSSEVANDIVGLLARHPGIRRIGFNGGTAEAAFRRHVPAAAVAGLQLLRLPSTSPANASWSFERKLAAWSAAFEE